VGINCKEEKKYRKEEGGIFKTLKSEVVSP